MLACSVGSLVKPTRVILWLRVSLQNRPFVTTEVQTFSHVQATEMGL